MSVKLGQLDQVTLCEASEPAVRPDEALVRIHASAVNPADLKVASGAMVGRFLHARTDPLVVGFDFSGVVEAVGNRVELKPGVEVFGHLPYSSSNRQGAFAELVSVPANSIAVKPSEVSHRAAAVAATVGLTALQALTNIGKLESGEKVLVIGAAGGVGSAAVQIAARLGGEVSAVCSGYALSYVHSLGASEVIDRKEKDPFSGDAHYDLVFDATGLYPFSAAKAVIKEKGGRFVTTLPSPGYLWGKLQCTFTSRSCDVVVVKSNRADLERLAKLLQAGMTLRVHRTVEVTQVADGFAAIEAGGVMGRIAVEHTPWLR